MPYEMKALINYQLKPSFKTKIECHCGELIQRRNLKTHIVSKNHITFMCMNGNKPNKIKIKANNHN
jgi:hypothetical protein